MLKQLKNRLLEIITENDLSLDLFVLTEENSDIMIELADTPLVFAMREDKDDFNKFGYSYNRFRPEYPLTTSHDFVEFGLLELSFGNWVKNDVKNMLAEIDTLNLWEQYEDYVHAIPSPAPPEADYEQFSDEEKNQVRVSVEEFRILLEEHFKPIEEQLRLINERLDYLSKSADRLNPFDWRALALTTAWDIGVLMGLNPDGVTKLSELMVQGFSNVMGLLTP